MLLPFSNDPKAPESNGFTPIQRAVQIGQGFVDENSDVIRLLIRVRGMQYRLDVNKTTKIPEGLFHKL